MNHVYDTTGEKVHTGRCGGRGWKFWLFLILLVGGSMLLAACRLGAATYVVKSVGAVGSNEVVTVTCWEKDVAGSEFTREWAVLAEVAPEVGAEWHCDK